MPKGFLCKKVTTIGASVIRIGFKTYYTITIIRNPQNSKGNC